jgi:solute:Na+ symporter, SSS family
MRIGLAIANFSGFPLAVFGPADWAVVAVYLALMAGIGAWAARRKTDAAGYFLAERQMPTWAVALSVVATSLSVATFNGAPQEAFTGDLTYLSLNLGGFLAVLVVATLFIPRFYQAGTLTIYGFIDQRYGEIARIAVSCMFLIGRLLASGARLFIAAIPLCLLLFHTFNPTKPQLIEAIILIGAIGTSYTIAGGIRAVIWTDAVQIIIVAGTAILSVALLLHWIPLSFTDLIRTLGDPIANAGHSKLRIFDTSWSSGGQYTIWTALIGATFLNTAAYGVDHDLAQRMLTARSAWRGGLSLLAAQCVSICVVGLFLCVGLLLYVFYRRPDVMGASAPTDELKSTMAIYPQFLLAHMPTGLAGLAIAGMFAAAQGSLDSAINAMASSAVSDLYWPIRKNLGLEVDKAGATPRVAVAFTGAVLIGFAIVSALRYDAAQRSLLNFALGVMTFAYTGMLGVFLTALLTNRGNTKSVLLSLLTGVVVTILLQDGIYARWTKLLLGQPHKLATFWWMPIGTIASFLVCVAAPKRAIPTS